MSKHAVGKWERGEGLEKKSARERAGLIQNVPYYSPGSQKCWCYLCNEAHYRVECPKVDDVRTEQGNTGSDRL